MQVQSSRPPRAKKRHTRLVKKDVEGICEELMWTKPEEILPKMIFRVEADAIHLHTFPARDQFV